MDRRTRTILAVGLALVALGVGNWRLGVTRLDHYAKRIAYARELVGPEVDRPYRGTLSILEERSGAHELYEDATAKHGYYRVVYRGGRLLTLSGCLVLAAGLLRSARKRATNRSQDGRARRVVRN